MVVYIFISFNLVVSEFCMVLLLRVVSWAACAIRGGHLPHDI